MKTKELITADEVAEILKIKRGTVYLWTYTGKIIPIKSDNHSLRFSLSEVNMLKEARRKAAEARVAKITKFRAEKEAKAITPEGYMTVKEAGRFLDLTKARVWQLHEMNELVIDESKRPGLISVADIEAYVQRKRRKNNGFVTVSTAVRILGVESKRIYKMANSGLLEFEKTTSSGNRILIRKSSIEKTITK